MRLMLKALPAATAHEQGPIRADAAVQPHGALLVLEPEAGRIEAASESCLEVLGWPADHLVGQSGGVCLGSKVVAALLDLPAEAASPPVRWTLNGRALIARITRNDAGLILVDVEPDEPAPPHFRHACRRLVQTLRQLPGLPAIAETAAGAIRALTGFDRVTVSRFDQDGHGEVIAESRSAALEPLLGLNFPLRDAALPARAARRHAEPEAIPEVRYRPSPLRVRSPDLDIDLGGSRLRGASAAQIAHCTRLGVRATLTAALLVDNRPWGLVTCQHHAGGKHLAAEAQEEFGWLCDDMAQHIGAALLRQASERQQALASHRRQLIESIRAIDFKILIRHHKPPQLLQAVGADGFALLTDSALQTQGNTPTAERIRQLQRRQACQTGSGVFATSCLTRDLGVDTAGDGVAGALFVSVANRPGSTLIWFRDEQPRGLSAVGDPLPHRTGPGPGQSAPWSDLELASAAKLGVLIEIDALREREAFSQTILDSIPEHLCVLDKHGVIVAVNSAWRRFAKANDCQDDESTSVGANYRATCCDTHGEPARTEAGVAWAGIAAVMHHRLASFSLDYPCDSPTVQRWFRMSVFPMAAPGEGVVVMHLDVTDRKQAELRAQRLLADQEAILNSAFAGIFRTADRKLTWANQTLADMFGYELAELVGQSTRQLFISEAAFIEMDRQVQRLERGGPVPKLEVQMRRKNGTQGWFEVGGTTLGAGNQDQVGTVVDISERKDAELELAQHRLQLETLVAKRTLDLARAKDAAEEANRAKSIFLATMSHELRTPMTAIIGMNRLALKRASDPKQVDQLGKVGAASQHLLGIIDDILDISRIEASKLELQRHEFSLEGVLDNLGALVRLQAAERSLDLDVQLAPELHDKALWGDAQRLRQVLLNLVSNAIKFTTQGSVSVRVTLAEDRQQDTLLRFEVQDTGIGIAVGDQQRVFEAFEQADGSTTRRYGGSGLGLAISRRLVQLMGGEIGLHSEPGRGSTFWFTGRFAKGARSDTAPASPAGPSALCQLQSRYTGYRVLVAEDEPVNREVIQALLAECGLVVHLAGDGVQAVEMAERGDYALILMDLQMPRMGGLAATRRVRSLPSLARLPIIALTASVFVEDEALCLAAGMDDFLAKPFDPDLMFPTLLKWLIHTDP